jgi:hypothetical protein
VIRNALIVCAAMVIWNSASLPGDEPVSIELDETIMQAPATMRMTVTVLRRDVNRSVRIEAESATYFRSSQIPLNGARAPSRYRIVYADVPEGQYRIRVEVRGTSDLIAVARRSAVVRGDDPKPLAPGCEEGACPP